MKKTSAAVKGCTVLKFHRSFAAKSVVARPLAAAVAGCVIAGAVWSGTAHADSGDDVVAKLKELSQQAEQLAQSMDSAQRDYDEKLRVLAAADTKHAADLAALEAAKAQLAGYQGTVNKVAAAVYMGGRVDSANAILSAASPKMLIDKLAVQQAIGTEMSAQMRNFRRIDDEARRVEAASAKSAADAKSAIAAAAAVRSDLQNKQSQLQTQVTLVKATFATLPPAAQAGVAVLPPSVVAALGPIRPIPTVGMGGLVPNARMLAAYIMATYPGVQSIGGVRSDPLPDHPSGRAIDIMVSDMALGDAINADIQRQAGRFGVAYTMWRVAAHFDHVHVTVS